MKKIIIILVLTTFLVSAFGVPLHPDKVRELKSSGEWSRIEGILESGKERGLNKPQRNTIFASKKNPGQKVSGTWKALVILVHFSDNVANYTTHDQAYYNTFFFSEGVMTTKSVREYYQEISSGQFDLIGDIAGWYTMPQTYAYYCNGEYGFGNYPSNAQKLVEDAIAAADPDVDFSEYDNDGDGTVDALFVIHAGPEGAGGGGNAIWSHAWVISSPKYYDGVYVYGYSMEPETSAIGVYCHEFGHVLGLPDLYDYGYDSAGIGKFGLMAAGSYGGDLNHSNTPVFMSAWSRYTLGWIEPRNVSTNIFNESIDWGTPSTDVYRLWTKGTSGEEYFLVENRRRGSSFDKYLPADGILIYHVDEGMSNNDNQLHKLVDIEEADGLNQLDNFSSYGDAGDYFPGNTDNRIFDSESDPNSQKYGGVNSFISVSGISDPGTTMTADLRVYIQSPTPTGVSLINYGSGKEAISEWNQVFSATEYQVFYGTDPNNFTLSQTTENTEILLDNLKEGETYYAKVKSFNNFEWSELSQMDSAYIYDILPNPPENLRASQQSGIVELRWDGVVGRDIRGYNIYSKESEVIKKVNSTPINLLRYTLEDLKPFREFELYVTAVDSTGNESDPSNKVSIMVMNDVKISIRNNVLNKAEGEKAVYLDLNLFSRTKVVVKLYSISGEEIKTLKEGLLEPGYYLLEWDGTASSGSPVSSGVYLLHIQLGFDFRTEKVVLLK